MGVAVFFCLAFVSLNDIHDLVVQAGLILLTIADFYLVIHVVLQHAKTEKETGKKTGKKKKNKHKNSKRKKARKERKAQEAKTHLAELLPSDSVGRCDVDTCQVVAPKLHKSRARRDEASSKILVPPGNKRAR